MSTDACIVANRAGSILKANRAFLDLVGSKTPGALQKYLQDEYLLPANRHCETQLRTARGVVRCVWKERVLGPYRYCLIRDNTEQYKLRTQLDMCSKRLTESEFSARFAREEASMLSYAVSHDLQEPLRTVANWATFIEEDYSDELPGSSREWLSYIKNAANRGTELVSDLLRLSRVGNAKFGWVDANSIVDSAVVDVEFTARETNAKIIRDELPVVWADPGLLRQLFKNLISNALKFAGDRDPEICIRCGSNPGYWEFLVEDNGIGVPINKQEEVFGAFRRLDASKPGTGIGLALCRKVVMLHSGRIEFDASKRSGSAVRFTLKQPSFEVRRKTKPDSKPGQLIVLAAMGQLRDRPCNRNDAAIKGVLEQHSG